MADFSQGDIQGIGMLMVAALMITIPSTLGDKPKSPWIYLVAVAGGLGLLAFLVDAFPLGALEGDPIRQIVLGGLSFTVGLMALPRWLLRITFAIVMIPATYLLAQHYATLTRSAEFTGAPAVIAGQYAEQEGAMLTRIAGELEAADRAPSKKGWLAESPAAVALSEETKDELNAFERPEAFASWHTPFTGVYEIRLKPMGAFWQGDGLVFFPMDGRVEKPFSKKPTVFDGPLLGEKNPHR